MSYNLLKGKRGIIFGALNDQSIAWKVAERAVEEGATITLSNTPMAIRMGEVDALAEKLNCQVVPADATSVEDLENVFKTSMDILGGQIDFVLHSVKVNRLDIIGYASPEGTLEVNKRLSEGRAMALRNYLATQYDFPKNQYHIQFGGENWDGLVKALATVEMDYKAEVMEIITNIPIEKGRETKLMQLRGGVPYRFMLKHIFPGLRVAICKVSYDIKNFNLEEAKEVIKKRPQNLSLNEMFVVANTYPKGSQEFIDIFETAVRIYPESEIANMNAATAALSRNDLVSAARYLERVKSEEFLPEYNNAMGVLLLMKEEYELSEKHLKIAKEAGLDAAEGNLEELAKKKANAIEIEKKNKNK